MWFLQCDGDLLGYKRLWLRPGSTHLLGRTTQADPGTRVQFIDNKSVSRKHLLITVDSVKPGDAAHLHTKTKLTVTDGSKLGTTVDGHKIAKESRTLDKDKHVIQLGTYEPLFRLEWQPHVLSFVSLTKAQKQAAEPLSAQRQQLEGLDIKCITEFVTQHTSHVVTKKRNTPAVLQALVNGRHVVTDAFMDAVQAAAQPQGGDRSKLEDDFDAAWPPELQYLPHPGNEPDPRPAHDPSYAPKEERAEVFARYTFIFCDPAQHQTLMPVVTGGGGKALLREVDAATTDIKDFVDYVKEVAGKKGVGAFKLSQQPARGGVVVVRAGEKTRQEVVDFYRSLDLALDQRSIEQNEFLGAILDVNASSLKRPLEIDMADEASNHRAGESQTAPPRQTRALSPAQHSQSPPADTSQAAPATTTTKRKPRRGPVQSRFKGFDDFDSSQLPKMPSPSQYNDDAASQAQSADMDVDSQAYAQGTQRASQSQFASGRKRPAESPAEEQETAHDVVEGFLKGAAVMKRRKLEEQRKISQSKGDDADQEVVPEQPATRARPKKRKTQDLDVMKAVHERREEEDRRRQDDEENLRTALEGMDVTEIRNLAQIEEMDIVRRSPPTRARNGEASDRWDSAWNGRRNFKRFKKVRPGQLAVRQNPALQRPRVIVDVEPWKPKTYGMGDEYWLKPVEQQQSRKKEQARERQRSQRSATAVADLDNDDGEHDGNDDDDAGSGLERFRRRIRTSRIEDDDAGVTDRIDPVEIAGTARDGDIEAAARAGQSQTSTQTLRATGTQGKGRKRPATEPADTSAAAAAASSAKRRRSRIAPSGSPRAVPEDSDEDDGLKFRRRRRS